MPDRKEQLVNGSYPVEYTIDDQVDAMLFLFKDMEKIATGRILPSRIKSFAAESLKGAAMIRTNQTYPKLQLK
jgi:hypothetical protein